MQPSSMTLPEIDWSAFTPDHEGISPTHAQSLEGHGHSEKLNHEKTVPEAPEETSVAESGPASSLIANPFPVALLGTSAQISPPPPPMSSLAVRQHVWRETYGAEYDNISIREPICGPFEVCVQLSNATHAFAGAQELLHQQFTLSWETEGSAYKLILDFAPGVDHNNPVNQYLLMCHWADVVDWADLVRSGQHMALASYLRDCMETQKATSIKRTKELM